MNSQYSCCKDKKNCPLAQQNSANGQFFSTNWELELELIAYTQDVGVRLKVEVVVAHVLIAIAEIERVLLGDAPLGTYGIACLLKRPGIVELSTGEGHYFLTLLLILHLQA